MAIVKIEALTLRTLKKQITELQKKEEAARNKLRAALQRVKKLGRVFRSRLALSAKQNKQKIAKAQSAIYLKVAHDIQRKMVRKAAAESKAIASAVAKFEKKYAADITKTIKQKAKKKKKSLKLKKKAKRK